MYRTPPNMNFHVSVSLPLSSPSLSGLLSICLSDTGRSLSSVSDVNECGDFTNGGCEQLCQNHPGGFNCSCREGYVARTDDPTKCQRESTVYPTAGTLRSSIMSK